MNWQICGPGAVTDSF